MTIKIIDFGLARCHSEVKTGMILQAVGFRYLLMGCLGVSFVCWGVFDFPPFCHVSSLFRAPEVMLGLPLAYAIDMWGVARILLCLLSKVLLPLLSLQSGV